jgi:predicted nucleic acid-binding protein
MIVAVESNFVIQLALKQEEGAAAQTILDLATEGQIRLAVPAFALFEPYGTLIRRHKKRDALLEELDREIREISRSARFAQLPATSDVMIRAIAKTADVEEGDLDSAIGRVAEVATVIPLTREIVKTAGAHSRSAYGLSPPDAIIFESVDTWLQAEADESKVFSTKDARAFMAEDVRDHLRKHNCQVIPTFADTLAFVEHRLAESPRPKMDA